MTKRLKVLLMITRAELGGGQTHVADLLRGMKDSLDCHLATGETGYLTEVAQQLGIPFHVLPHLVQPMNPADDLRAIRECHALLRELRPDLLHAHTSKAGIVGRAAARLAGVPSVFTAHTWCFAEGTSWKWKLIGTPLEKLAAAWSGRIINVSDANRALAIKRSVGRADRHVTIHNGIPDNPLRARPGYTGPVRILMLARFAPQKAQSLLLQAVRGLDMPFELLFAGDGPMRGEVERHAASLGLGNRVRFLGQRLDVPELLALSHVFALFTHWEGFPISILEAMRAGLPVVASAVGGVAEAVNDTCGRVIAPGDVAGFRAALAELIASPALREQLGKAARARYEREYTLEAMLGKTLAVYRAAISTGDPEPASYPAHSTGAPSY